LKIINYHYFYILGI